MHLITRNVNTAFKELVTRVLTTPEDFVEQPSRNGKVIRFRHPVTITYERPTECVLFNKVRDANPFFHLYEALWMLAGRNDVAPLTYYVKRMTEFSDDGTTLNGAYGYRWRHAKVGVGWRGNQWYGGTIPDRREEVDQLKEVVCHLRSLGSSRRAVITMWNAEDDLLNIGGKPCECCGATGSLPYPRPWEPYYEELEPCPSCAGKGYASGSRDVCCNLSAAAEVVPCEACDASGFQAEAEAKERAKTLPPGVDVEVKTHGAPCTRCRGTKQVLNLTVFNRSNDVVWGMLGANAVHFSFLLQYLAGAVGVGVGSYSQVSSNAHFYTGRHDWNPTGWAADWLPDGPNTPHAYTANPTWAVEYPLLADAGRVEEFDAEVAEFVTHHSGSPENPVTHLSARKWKTPFLRDVAEPLMLAHHSYKYREYLWCGYWLATCRARDWAEAAAVWVYNRLNRKAAKEKEVKA